MAVSEERVSRDDLVILQRKVRTPWRDAWQQMIKNKMSVGAAIFIVLLALTAIFADFTNGYRMQGYWDEFAEGRNYPYAKQLDMSKRLDTSLEKPLVVPLGEYNPTQESRGLPYDGFVFIFGADNLGRDILSRVVYGSRVSLEVALVGAGVSFIIGMVYGMVSAFFGGQVDNIMMRIVDILWGYPLIVFVILLQVYFKALTISYDKGEEGNVLVQGLLELNQKMGGILFIFIALGMLNWLGMARLVRGQVLSYKEKEFIEAARCIGANNWRILFSHLLPNVLGPCIVYETMAIPGYIYTEAFLSFIGLGVNAPTPSWGIMLADAYPGLRSFWWPVVFPSIALSLTVLAFNFFGDGLRDALDPRVYER